MGVSQVKFGLDFFWFWALFGMPCYAVVIVFYVNAKFGVYLSTNIWVIFYNSPCLIVSPAHLIITGPSLSALPVESPHKGPVMRGFAISLLLDWTIWQTVKPVIWDALLFKWRHYNVHDIHLHSLLWFPHYQHTEEAETKYLSFCL